MTRISTLIAPNFTFKPGVEAALKQFAKSKPWKGSVADRRQKFQTLHNKLTEIFEVKTSLEFYGENPDDMFSGLSRSTEDRILLVGRLSVITYLTLFALVVTNGNRDKSDRWAYNLFKRFFPRSFGRLTTRQPNVIR